MINSESYIDGMEREANGKGETERYIGSKLVICKYSESKKRCTFKIGGRYVGREKVVELFGVLNNG